MTEEKKGRGRPKGAPNKPKLELITKREELLPHADAYEIMCQANIVAQKEPELAAQGLQVFNDKNAAIRPTLMWAFNDDIVSTLPEGTTPFNANSAPGTDLTESSLKFEARKFKYFTTEQISPLRRETMWIELLESIAPMEAKMIDLVKDGHWPFKNITKDIAQMAFPNDIK